MSYGDFSNETFRVSLINNLSSKFFVNNNDIRLSLINSLPREFFTNNNDELEKFCKTTMDTLNSFAPIKKKYAYGNQMPFMTKNRSKEKMTRSRLRNRYLKHKTEENRLLYTQQRYRSVSILRKTKMNYYGNLDEKNVTDNKKKLENY